MKRRATRRKPRRVGSRRPKPKPKGRGRREASISPQSAQIFYQASANRKLGNPSAAEDALKKLLEAAQTRLWQRMNPLIRMCRRRRDRRRAGPGYSHYLAGLAHLGLGENEAAKEQFMAALAACPDLVAAKVAEP